jgi:hypothetical protein
MVQVVLEGLARPESKQASALRSSARLFYNYLRLSSSYAAGCTQRPLGSKKTVSSRGAKVLTCVTKYRDVYKTSFEDWVCNAGSVRMMTPSLLPEIFTATALQVGHQSDLFIRFPYGRNAMPQLELFALIAAKVPSVSRETGGLRLTPVMEKNLWRDVYLAYLLKNYPDTELWRLGAEAMLVERFIGKVEPTGRRMNSSQDYERRLLVATVIRHRAWAANVSEHAAIDEFPCKDPIPNTQPCLEFEAVDLLPELATHSLDEVRHAREQVIRCTGAGSRVSAEPSFKHQGVLF